MPGLKYLILLVILHETGQTNGYGYRELGEDCEPRRIKNRVWDGDRDKTRDWGRDRGRDRNQIWGPDERYSPKSHSVPDQSLDSDFRRNYDSLPPINETRKCRSELGLYCDPWTRKCKCHEMSGAVYNYDKNRCELSIDHFCTTKTIDPIFAEEHGGLEYEHFCPDDALCMCNYHLHGRYWRECDNANGLCKCKYTFKPYEDNRGCWYSKANPNFIVSGITILIPLGVWLVYFLFII